MDEFSTPAQTDWQTIHNRGYGQVQYNEDRNKVVFFYLRPVPDPDKSRETGRPWKKNVTFVRIAPPGERLNIVDRPATSSDAQRWPMQYAQFKQKQAQLPEGTPIDLLYPTDPAIGETLKGNNVYTIEQCAALSGNAIESIGMGAQAWVNAAVAYIKRSAKGVKASQLQAELDQRDQQIRTLTRQVEDLTGAIQRLQASQNNEALVAAQTLIAQQMGRPQHMPQQAFDAQTAQINANSPTHIRSEAVKSRRGRERPRLTR